MAASINDKFLKVGVAGTLTSLSAPGHSIAGTTITVGSTTNWPTDTAVIFGIRQVDSGGELVAGTYTEWRGVVSGSTLTSMVLMYGSDQIYPAGSTTQVFIPLSAARDNRLVDGILVEHNQDGTHNDITADTLSLTGALTGTTATFDSVEISGTATSQGWTTLGDVPDTVTPNATVPRVYDLVFNGEDHTDTLSNSMKLQLTRTVAAPSQCTDLESSSSQYYSKSSPNGMTFTDDFAVSAWIKLESYTGSPQVIASRYGSSNGWRFYVEVDGSIVLAGYSGSINNNSNVQSYAAIPLNKWVHVAAQLDMSAFSATTTTSYIMIDGVDVTAKVGRAGTNPTSLVQGGNLEIGSFNGGSNYFDGKIAQVAIYSAKVTQATILASINRTLTGSETSLVSAYSFNNTINDLSANANNLTAQNSAVATNADSPFANAVSAGSLEYAEVLNVAFSTNTTVTVRVPDGCQIPTSGGISSVYYSTQSNPYGLPAFSNVIGYAQICSSISTAATSPTQVLGLSCPVYIPAGKRARYIISARAMVNGTSNTTSPASVWDGTVGSGTQIMETTTSYPSTGGTSTVWALNGSATTLPTTGLHTFNAGYYGSGGTTTIQASTAYPAYISVELV